MSSIDWSQVETSADRSAAADRAFRDRVNAERTRRIALGASVEIDAFSIWVTGRPEDQRNLANLSVAAQAKIAAGDLSLFNFRDGRDDVYPLTPPQMVALHLGSVAHVGAIYEASWAIKAMPEPVADVTDGALWP